MAFIPSSFAVSVLLLSLVTLASATYDGYTTKPDVKKPYPGNGYVPKPDVKKPYPGNGYVPKPDVKKPYPNSEYVPKPDIKKPYPEAKEKLQLPSLIGIQGLVYCKSGPKLIPLKGAVARITCLTIDEQGYETAPFSILSEPADIKGYFFATLSTSLLENSCKISECKAFLEYSPLETCKVPTDVNNGMSGVDLLSSSLFSFLNNKKMKLYSVGPFFYTPQPQPPKTPSTGY